MYGSGYLVANVRQHGTTGEAPRLRFERDEQDQLGDHLTPAALAPQVPTETRKVDKTGLLPRPTSIGTDGLPGQPGRGAGRGRRAGAL